MYSEKPVQLRRQPKCYRSPVSEIKHRELAFACGRLVAFPAKLRLPVSLSVPTVNGLTDRIKLRVARSSVTFGGDVPVLARLVDLGLQRAELVAWIGKRMACVWYLP